MDLDLNAIRAEREKVKTAEADVTDEPRTLTLGKAEFELPDRVSLKLARTIRDDDIVDFWREVLGPQYPLFEELVPDREEAVEFASLVIAMYGASPGESRASSGSSKRTGGRSRRTSKGSTAST